MIQRLHFKRVTTNIFGKNTSALQESQVDTQASDIIIHYYLVEEKTKYIHCNSI